MGVLIFFLILAIPAIMILRSKDKMIGEKRVKSGKDSISLTQFVGLLSEGFIKVLNDISAYKKILPSIPDNKIRQEITALNVFEILLSSSSVFKNNEIGPKFFKSFLKKFEEDLVDIKLFDDVIYCDKFIQKRLMSYNQIVDIHLNDNYLPDLSFKISEFFGGNNISSSVALITIFHKNLLSDMELLKNTRSQIYDG